MTDNEIIKALECCSEAKLKEDCKKLKCPFFDNEIYNCMNVDDENAMYRYSLDLINRQKSQILKEQNKNSKLRNERNHLKAEIEELNGSVKSLEDLCETKTTLLTDANWSLITARTETGKEFLNKARERSYESSDWSHGEHPFVVEWDDLVEIYEEMVGEG